jgi:hypothetical protein
LYFIENFNKGAREPGAEKKSVRLSMVSLAFKTQAIPGSQMFVGLIRTCGVIFSDAAAVLSLRSLMSAGC